MSDGAVHNNESKTAVVISSPTAGISCGVLESISGCLLQQYELITSMLKVKIYIVAKSVLVFAFRTPGELPDAGWPWAAESILPSSGPAPVSGDSVPSTCVALLRVQRETCGFALLWAEGISCS